jgi:hypothetical protein
MLLMPYNQGLSFNICNLIDRLTLVRVKPGFGIAGANSVAISGIFTYDGRIFFVSGEVFN